MSYNNNGCCYVLPVVICFPVICSIFCIVAPSFTLYNCLREKICNVNIYTGIIIYPELNIDNDEETKE
jgi:hypothetical protein